MSFKSMVSGNHLLDLIWIPSYEIVSALMPCDNVTHSTEIGGYMIFFFIEEMIKKYSSFFKNHVFNYKLLIPLSIIWILSIGLYFYINGIISNADAVDVVTYGDFLPKLIGLLVFFNLFINFKHNWLFHYFDRYGKRALII